MTKMRNVRACSTRSPCSAGQIAKITDTMPAEKKRGSQEFNIPSSRCLRELSLSLYPQSLRSMRASAIIVIKFIFHSVKNQQVPGSRRLPTNVERSGRARVRRIRSCERKTAIIINNSTAQRHRSTMDVLLEGKWQR